MKLSKTSWMILLAGIFIVVIASLGLARYQQLGAQQTLRDELSIANARVENLKLDHLREREADLRQQLEERQSLTEDAKERLRNDMVQSIEIVDEFFDIAHACNVEVVNLNTTELTGEELQSVVCLAVPFSGEVEGTFADVVRFVHKLNSDYATGVVKEARISIETEEGEYYMSPNMASAAEVRLIAYTYEGN